MTCWQCKHIIIVPGRVIPADGPYPQTDTTEVACPTCGTVYRITTTRMGKLMKTEPKVDEAESDNRSGWD